VQFIYNKVPIWCSVCVFERAYVCVHVSIQALRALCGNRAWWHGNASVRLCFKVSQRYSSLPLSFYTAGALWGPLKFRAFYKNFNTEVEEITLWFFIVKPRKKLYFGYSHCHFWSSLLLSSQRALTDLSWICWSLSSRFLSSSRSANACSRNLRPRGPIGLLTVLWMTETGGCAGTTGVITVCSLWNWSVGNKNHMGGDALFTP